MSVAVHLHGKSVRSKRAQAVNERKYVRNLVGFAFDSAKYAYVQSRSANVKATFVVYLNVIYLSGFAAQNIFESLYRVERAAERTHEIVSAPRRYKAERGIRSVDYSVKHLVESSVSAERDDGAAVFSKIAREFGCVSDLVRDMKSKGNTVIYTVFNYRVCILYSAAAAAFYVRDYI